MNQEMKIVSWRELKKGDSLQGFLSIALISGLQLNDVSYHKRRDGSRWIAMPARPYEKTDGGTGWAQLVEFTDRSARDRFNKQALQALDNYFAQQAAVTKPAVNAVNEESPF